MKSFFRYIITKLLASKARRFLKKHKVQVIAVTGSMGKTTTKQAIYHILSQHFDVYASPEGFNTEIGMSLAILRQEKSGFSSARAWFKILKNVFTKEIKPYQKIILEMGADHPGDIEKLVKIAPPDIGAVLTVSPVHLAKGQFEDVEAISHEKNMLVRHMKSHQVAILNYDNDFVRAMQTGGKRFSFGTNEGMDLYASDVQVDAKGIHFKAHYDHDSVLFKVPVLGEFQVYTLLPAIAVALQLNLTLADCQKALADFKLPPGRMSSIEGVKKTTILDGSYNASPATMRNALDLLFSLEGKRKIAALGTMNELGEMTKDAHLELGKQAAKTDMLIAVGPEAASIKKGALKAGMPEMSVYTFLNSVDAGHFLEKKLEPGDLILVKGSQNKVRMEKLIQVIMKHPEKAGELLCRQGEMWEKI